MIAYSIPERSSVTHRHLALPILLQIAPTWEQHEHDVPAGAVGRALLLRGCVQQRQQAGVAQPPHDCHLVLCLAYLVLASA